MRRHKDRQFGANTMNESMGSREKNIDIEGDGTSISGNRIRVTRRK